MIICEINVKVSFLKHTIIKKDFGVVEGDYNTTKMVFEFEEDVSDQRIVFKMSNPDGELILMKDLVDNEVTLVGYDDEGEVYSLFNTAGLHAFELVLYGDDSKLTSATGWLNVNKRQVNVGMEGGAEYYLPIMDEILSNISKATVYTSQNIITRDITLVAIDINGKVTSSHIKKGVDYWTEEDKAALIAHVDEIITKEINDALDDKADKPSGVQVIVDNQDGDSSIQSFVYTLPSDDTVITIDGPGYPDHILMNAVFDEGYWRGDNYSLSNLDTTLPANLPAEAQAQWKAGTTIRVAYNSDAITSAIATYPGGRYATETYVNAEIQKAINQLKAELIVETGGDSNEY